MCVRLISLYVWVLWRVGVVCKCGWGGGDDMRGFSYSELGECECMCNCNTVTIINVMLWIQVDVLEYTYKAEGGLENMHSFGMYGTTYLHRCSVVWAKTDGRLFTAGSEVGRVRWSSVANLCKFTYI